MVKGVADQHTMAHEPHKIKRSHEGGVVRVSCSCGVAFNTDNARWADEWQQAHLLGIIPSGRRKRKHEVETP